MADQYIRDSMPGYYVKSVPRDGLCILHAFRECLLSIGVGESYHDVVVALRNEIQKDIYNDIYSSSLNGVNLVQELDRYIENPLAEYDSHISDIYLEALGMAYGVNIIVFQSNCEEVRILENINADNHFEHTVYFVRTLSLHFDPVIPVFYADPAEGSESGDSVTITDFITGQNVSKNSKAEIKPDPDAAREEYENSKDDPLHDSTNRVATHPSEYLLNDFNFKNPSGASLINALLVEPTKYEVSTPLKQVRQNKMFTVRDCLLSDITSDDNGSYNESNRNNRLYYVKFDENSVNKIACLNIDPGESLHYKERVGRNYKDISVSSKDVYRLNRYYRLSKSIPGLKMMIATIESYDGKDKCPYFCVVYSLVEEADDDVKEVKCLPPHGNSKQPIEFSQPYIRTNPAVLKNIDDKLEKCGSVSSVFYDVLVESGGPMHSGSQSNEPRNTKQVNNRKSLKALKRKKENPTTFNMPLSDLDKLILAQRDPKSLVRTVVVWGDTYLAFVYSDKMLRDIELFCCNEYDNEACVLGIDTTFGLCDMWVTDTSYRNKRLLSARSRSNPVHLGPVMFHISKDDETFRRFCMELIASNPNLINLRKVGVDMEAAIYSGFRSVIPKLLELYCVKHLQDRDKIAIDKLHNKTTLSDDLRASYKKEILWDLYGRRYGTTFETGIADASDADEFNARLNSLNPRWEKLCPGFFQWFMTHRKKDFETSVIKSAREGTNIAGLYYQNDVESLHASEKRIQLFKKGSVLEAVATIETLIQREEYDEEMALYGGGNHVLSMQYKTWFSAQWHSWKQERKDDHKKRFRNCKPLVENSFVKPGNVGRKPNQSKRVRMSEPTNVVERPSTTLPSLVTSSAPTTVQQNISFEHQPCSSTLGPVSTTSLSANATSTNSLTQCNTSTSNTSASSTSVPTSLSLSFEDPRLQADTLFELHVRSDLPKLVKRCRGNCGRDILQDHQLVVKSAGIQRWISGGVEKSKAGPLFIHFKEECLKNYDSKNYYAPNEPFKWEQITISSSTKSKLTAEEVAFLLSLGIN